MREVIGHQEAQTRLAQAASTGQVSHAYLFTGPASTGKTTLALEFAKLLQCEGEHAEGEPCGVCPACRKIAHGNHPDVTLVEAEEGKRQLGIDTVREEVVRMANLAPSSGRWRIFILPEVERMTPNTVNALLKTLEEPPEQVVLLLTSAEPENLLPTLLSRCQVINLRPLSQEQIISALEQRWQIAPAEARELAELAHGRLGWAVRAHEKPALREERAERLTMLLKLAAAPRDERLRLAKDLAADGETARQVLELWTLWWRDVTLAAYGAAHLASGGAARSEAERQGRALGPERASAFLRALLAAQAALDANANPRLTIEVLLLDLPYLPVSAARR